MQLAYATYAAVLSTHFLVKNGYARLGSEITVSIFLAHVECSRKKKMTLINGTI